MPYLPIEMIDEIFFSIGNAEDLINIIKALFFTRTYYDLLKNESYLWRHLIKIHYPYYNLTPNENKFKTFIKLLKGYPNRLNEENWKLAVMIDTLAYTYPCPVTYSLMRGDVAYNCINVDYRLVKKLFDTEYTKCEKNSTISIPKQDWTVNVILNTYHSCQGINISWVKAFSIFIESYFPSHIVENIMLFLKVKQNPLMSYINKDENIRQQEKEIETKTCAIISTYLQESISHTYTTYEIHTNIYQ